MDPPEVLIDKRLRPLFVAVTLLAIWSGVACDGSFRPARVDEVLAAPTPAKSGLARPKPTKFKRPTKFKKVDLDAPSGDGPGLEAIAVTPDGSKAYVAYERGSRLTVIDAVNDVILRHIVIPPRPKARLPIRLAIDPDGRHLFLVDPARRELLVFDTSVDSLAVAISVPAASRSVAFDFSAAAKRVYVTNQRDNAVLVFEEVSPGAFNPQPSLTLRGRVPGPIAVLPDGRLIVGHLRSHELELVDPTLPPASATVAIVPLGSQPFDIVVSGPRVLVPTFTPTPTGPNDGRNELLEIDPVTLSVVGVHLVNVGTNYTRAAVSSGHLVLSGSASGSLIVSDPLGFGLLERVDLAPGEPVTRAIDVALVPPQGGGVPEKAFVLQHFRRSIRPVDLSSGPPFALLPEIVLAKSGAPRLPLRDLSPEEDGEWFFTTVSFFNGTASNPNNVSCSTCHPRVGTDGGFHLFDLRTPPSLFNVTRTGPWGSGGDVADLEGSIPGAFAGHGILGGTIPPTAAARMIDFFEQVISPRSPFLLADGSLSPEAALGRVVFENQAGCDVCHSAPLLIPSSPAARTLPGGVGTGLVPANVPSLLGLWNTAPYLLDGSAATLMDVLDQNVGDQHGTTSTLSQAERDELVAYLLSL